MPLYEKYTSRHRDDFVTLEDLVKNYKLNIPDDFNFAFDCLDVIADQTPDKLAMLWLSNEGEENGSPLTISAAGPTARPGFFKTEVSERAIW